MTVFCHGRKPSLVIKLVDARRKVDSIVGGSNKFVVEGEQGTLGSKQQKSYR